LKFNFEDTKKAETKLNGRERGERREEREGREGKGREGKGRRFTINISFALSAPLQFSRAV
jgi:hypothetical protein